MNIKDVAQDFHTKLNEQRILHYFRQTTDNDVIFYIQPSQHFDALKFVDSFILYNFFNISYGIDSDFDYWINISKR